MILSNAISKKLAKNLYLSGDIKESEYDAYRYCIDYFVELSLYFVITFFIGVLLGYPLLGLLNCIIIIPIRSVCGGYHASSRLRCTIMSYGYFFIIYFILQHYTYINEKIWCIIFLACALTIFFSPSTISINYFSGRQKARQVLLRRFFPVILCISYLVTFSFEMDYVYPVIVICTLFAVLNMLIGIFTTKPEVE